MGITVIRARLLNPAETSRFADVKFVVDSGAMYSVAPRSVLQALGIEPHQSQSFYMVDGTAIERQMGFAFFEYRDRRTSAPVIFGEEGDASLMGATTLEGFGFILDPFRRELRPMLMRM